MADISCGGFGGQPGGYAHSSFGGYPNCSYSSSSSAAGTWGDNSLLYGEQEICVKKVSTFLDELRNEIDVWLKGALD